ncbi:MAG: SprT family zinc-dependent metalloprotease [Humidesulfovibrio sp.]|uniref:M48 family metallopeptidase n=1 Tax=Humidesulfovibrio sp. TaxID=2910988 RepID=UPI002735E424|nr:SprT family zinc-dependent metalloprotease [Humidesulfovibrio sp.]MDP2847287.1 SprT family zinc-dependent metalloprotease [Humidesulfovibrio sp.]
MLGFLKHKPAAPTQVNLVLGEERIAVAVEFDRFRTLRISIRRDGTVRVRAPKGASLTFVHEHLQAKAPWIELHLARFRDRRQAAPPLHYVNGEAHPFLGQRYTLLVRQEGRNSVRLAGDGLLVTTRSEPKPETVRKLLDAWHLDQAREVFTKVIRELLPRMDAHGAPRPQRLKIRAMTSRWGSCSRAGCINLNRHLIKAPLPCIEFVAAHELCHLRHHGHNAQFYALLTAVMPDWRERKKLLADQPVS